MFSNTLTSVLLSSVLAVAAFAPAIKASAATPEKPAEIYCEVRSTGKTLDCYFFEDFKKKGRLAPNQIADFIDAAEKNAYMTVKSKAGAERTFQVNPTTASFAKLKDIKVNGSASEISSEKIAVFELIEKRAIEISNNLDAEQAKVSILKFDPSVPYKKFVPEVLDMRANYADLKASCSSVNADGKPIRDCYNRTEALALVEDNKNLTRYLTELLNAMQSPTSCLANKKLKVELDGSVDLSQVTDLAKAFKSQCSAKAVAEKGGKTIEGMDYFKTLVDNNHGKLEFASIEGCSKDYAVGPYIMSAEAISDKPFCYGAVRCGSGKTEKTVRVMCEADTTGSVVYCPKATDCFNRRQANVWTEKVRIAP